MEAETRYADLEIRIFAQQNEGYPVEITLDRTRRLARGYLQPDSLGTDLSSFDQSLPPLERGRQLFEALFADDQLKKAWAQAEGENPQRRIRLSIDDSASELFNIPWELLSEPSSGRPQPLAISSDTPFSRYVSHDLPPGRPVTELPIRLLVVIANPNNLSQYQLAPLDIEVEKRIIEEAIAGMLGETIQVTFLSQPITLKALDAELRKGYHLLHLVSHGAFSEQRQEGIIFLSDEDGSVAVVSQKRFASLLARQRKSLQLVFFAGPQTARRDAETMGFVFGTIEAGIPASVGTQDIVPLEDVRAFTTVFYDRLIQHGQVDLACNEARSSLFVQREDSIWGSWVLASQLPDNQLLDRSILEQISTKQTEAVSTTIDVKTADEVKVTEHVEAAEEPAVVPGPRIGTIGGATSDEVAQEDYLGFEHYVEAFARLIVSEDTDPPLTIGIFGSWGMGKSFLLQHIMRRVREQSEQGSPRVHVVSFNAWEYSANELIWPGLVRKIMQDIEKEVSWGGLSDPRFRQKAWRNFKSQILRKRARLIIFIAVLIAIVGLAVWQFRDDLTALIPVFTALGVTGLIGLIKQIYDAVSEPLSPWITALFEEDSDYGKPIDYMAQIRDDLDFLGEKLGEDQRVLILIDDLDRCEPEKAVEVLQAIKLLLNFKQFIVCLGIDARVITRAIEKYYEGLLGPAGASGYEYLDKIVQIPFLIPEPNPDEVKEFINKQMGEPLPPLLEEESEIGDIQIGDLSREPSPSSGLQDRSDGLQDVPEPLPEPSDTEKEETTPEDIEPTAFVYNELEAFQNLARFLRPNPRHLKRLLNVYRLVRTLATLKQQRVILDNPTATIRWLVLCAQWPYTAYTMLYQYNEMLEDKAEGKLGEWPSDDPLIHLFEQAQKILLPEKQRKLDHDPDLLGQLLDLEEGRLTWDDLRIIRQYTINFNPAVEAELQIEASTESEEADQSEESPPQA